MPKDVMQQTENYEDLKARLQQSARGIDPPLPLKDIDPTDDERCLSRLGWAMKAGRVKRMHTMHTLKDHTLHEHTAKMMHLALALSPMALSHDVVTYIMVHDVPEVITGDIPAPMKGLLCEHYASIEESVTMPDGDTLNMIKGMESIVFDKMLGVHRKRGGMTLYDTYLVQFVDCLEFLHTCWEERMLGNLTFDEEVKRIGEYIKKTVEDLDKLLEGEPIEAAIPLEATEELSRRVLAATDHYTRLYINACGDVHEKGLYDAVMCAPYN